MNIDGTRDDHKCRISEANDETITHIIFECPKLLQKEYKRLHDGIGKNLYWDISRNKGFNVSEKWYEHKPLPCTENESFKILWDFHIQKDNIIEHRRPDIIDIDKTIKKAQNVEFAVPTDHLIPNREKLKTFKI